MNFGAQICRQCVDTGYTHAMQTAGNLICAFVEFTAGVEYGQHNFKRALVLFLVHVDRNTAAIVHNRDRIVLVDGHVDMGGISSKGFVNGVVNNFIN